MQAWKHTDGIFVVLSFFFACFSFFFLLLSATNLYCADYALKLSRTPYDLLNSVLILYWEQMSTQSPKTTLALLPLIRAFSYFQLKFWWILSVAGKIKPLCFILLLIYFYLFFYFYFTLIPFWFAILLNILFNSLKTLAAFCFPSLQISLDLFYGTDSISTN